jgi:HEPN superfamily RiboL-PSP-like protein
MYSALRLFEKNISESSQLLVLFEFTTLNLPSMNFDDLLRAHLVYSVSAFDKLIHDIIKIGMLEIFLNKRLATSKYLSEGISLEIHNKISNATIPPKEFYFESEVTKKLSFLSFQDPNKVAEGLSLIWGEPHKWQQIADSMGLEISTAKITLKTISARRNQIVHEADIDISTGKKYSISKAETENAANFVLNCGRSIYNNVYI